jgi:hypothetical protein
VQHAQRLALIAADLDTANVAEPFALFMASAERLCLEREMRSGRDPGSVAAAEPMLTFLTDGQERYFFELHRFSSDYGRHIFQDAKQANAEKLTALTRQLRERLSNPSRPLDGAAVLAAFHALSAAFA